MRDRNLVLRTGLLIILLLSLTACAGTVIEDATDAAIAVAKVPFKVGAAVIGAVTRDDDKKKDQDQDTKTKGPE